MKFLLALQATAPLADSRQFSGIVVGRQLKSGPRRAAGRLLNIASRSIPLELVVALSLNVVVVPVIVDVLDITDTHHIVSRLMLMLFRRTSMVRGLHSRFNIVAVVPVLRRKLAGGIRMIILVGSADMIIVVTSKVFRTVGIIRGPSVAS